MKKLPILIAVASMMSLVSCGNQKPEKEITPVETSVHEQQLDFEEQYISAKFSYGEGGKFAMSMISNLANIAAGVGFDSPTSVVSGVMGLLTCINDNLNGSNGPTIADVMNKLAEMDTKLDAINEKLDQNYNQLMTESIRTQAMVDQVLLEEQEQAIWNFNTSYIVPLEDYDRDFSDYLEQSYKTYVKESQTADFYIVKNEKGEWCLNSLMDAISSDAYEVTFTVDDFTGSKAFLEKNYDCIAKGFMDRFNEDIDNALENVVLPAGLEKKMARDFAAANLVENLTKQYYADNHQKALDIRNLAINLAKQISGKSSKSIVDRYVSRLQYMFNFAGEMKGHVTDTLSNILYSLNTYVTIAAQACVYAGVNQEELRSEFITAKDLVKQYYDSVKAVDDSYCFLTNTKLTGGFYRAMFNTYYTNKGNSCVFHSNFKFESVHRDINNRYVQDDVNAHSYLSEIDHLRIVMRWTLMREIGLNASNSYAEYLVGAKVLPEEAYNTYKTLLATGWISNDALRFFTGLTTRDMNDSDRSLEMTCTEAGNPGGDYFNVGWKGNYRGAHDAGQWNGKMAETTYIDGVTGQIQSNKKVCAYATYAESHIYWIDDEYWSFVDNTAGNYFLTLENVVTPAA